MVPAKSRAMASRPATRSAMASGTGAAPASPKIAPADSRKPATAALFKGLMRRPQLLEGEFERARLVGADAPLADDLAGLAVERAMIGHRMAHPGGAVI